MSHNMQKRVHMDTDKPGFERVKKQSLAFDSWAPWANLTGSRRRAAWARRKLGFDPAVQAKTYARKEEEGKALATLKAAAKNGRAGLAEGSANLLDCAEFMASRNGITPQDMLAMESARKKTDFELYRIARRAGAVFKPASLREVVSAIAAKARGERVNDNRKRIIVAIWEAECPLLPMEKERLERELAANGKAGMMHSFTEGNGRAGHGK